MSKKVNFGCNSLLKPICDCFTGHRFRKLIGWDKSFSDFNYQNVEKHDFYYKCRVCGFVYFNHCPTEKELNFIKEYDLKERRDRFV